MADRSAMTFDQYSAAMAVVVEATRALLRIPTDQLQGFLADLDMLGPVLDPTGYRDGMADVHDQQRLVDAAHALRQVAVDIREREGVSP